VLKASRGGYDGRGVWVVRDEAEARQVIAEAHANGLVLLAERHLDLQRELAVLVARRANGEIAVWEPVETVQRDGICNELRIPAVLPPSLIADAERYAREIAEAIGMVGIMAVEFFVAGGRVLINELAPRPHNSGHWTIDGAETSQFEQHLRAVLDLPLGEASLRAGQVCTVNILGAEGAADPRDVLAAGIALPGVHVHLYGKEPRPGRKIGHVTVTGTDRDAIFDRAWAGVRALLAPQEGQGR
jgi:5-(carboxyamino)imidazole ribonucleotide synthase